MSRKDYKLFAEMVAKELRFLSEDDRQRVAIELARTLRSENSRFDYDRFYDACEVKVGE